MWAVHCVPEVKAIMPRAKDSDSIQEFREWQDHQYDPGYNVGGRIPPMYLGKRPNKYGYVLLLLGSLPLALVAVITILPWVQSGKLEFNWIAGSGLLVLFSFGLLRVISGIGLLRKREQTPPLSVQHS